MASLAITDAPFYFFHAEKFPFPKNEWSSACIARPIYVDEKMVLSLSLYFSR